MPSVCVECSEEPAAPNDYKCFTCRDKEEGRTFPHLENIFGQVLVPGDTVVWPLNVGRSAEIAYGEIVKIYYGDGGYGRKQIKAQVQPLNTKWHTNYSYDKDENGDYVRHEKVPRKVTLSKPHNMVKMSLNETDETSEEIVEDES